MRTAGIAAAVGIGLVALAGCGSGSSTSTGASASAGSGYGAPAPSTSKPSSSSAANVALVGTKHSKLGTILAAGNKRLTVYLFEADKNGRSACSGACATEWPPVTTASAPKLGAGANASALGTIMRSDGRKQVTYNGHPLYYFARDTDSEDAYGQGLEAFGAEWYALEPSGAKVDES